MAITYQGAGAATSNTVASTSCVVAYPAGIAVGDLIVMSIHTAGLTIPTAPAGWTTGVGTNAGGTTTAFRMFYRIADGTESGTVSATTPSAQNQGIMLLFRGVDQTTPIDVAGTTYGNSAAATAFDIPSITTTRTGVALVVAGATNGTAGTWTPPTVPAAFTEVWDSGVSQPSSTAAYLIWSGSGATGTINLVKSNSIKGVAGVLPLRPSSGAFSSTASVAATVTVTASGAVAGNTDASVTATAVTSASGVLSVNTTAALASTVTVAATGVVSRSTTATLAATATTTATGTVGTSTTATLTATVTVTAVGSLAASQTAVVTALATVTAAGVVGRSSSASLTGVATVSATGRNHAPATVPRLITQPREVRQLTVTSEPRTVTVPAEQRRQEVR